MATRVPSNPKLNLWAAKDQDIEDYIIDNKLDTSNPAQLLAHFVAQKIPNSNLSPIRAFATEGSDKRLMVAMRPGSQNQGTTDSSWASVEVLSAGWAKQNPEIDDSVSTEVLQVGGRLHFGYKENLPTSPFKYTGKFAGYRYAAESIIATRNESETPSQFSDVFQAHTASMAQGWATDPRRQGNPVEAEMLLNTVQVKNINVLEKTWEGAMQHLTQKMGWLLNPNIVGLTNEPGSRIANISPIPEVGISGKWKREKGQFRQRFPLAIPYGMPEGTPIEQAYRGVGTYNTNTASGNQSVTWARVGIATPKESDTSSGGVMASSEFFARSYNPNIITRLEVPEDLRGFKFVEDDKKKFGVGQYMVAGYINRPDDKGVMKSVAMTENPGGSEYGKILSQHLNIGTGLEIANTLTRMLGEENRGLINLGVMSPAIHGNTSLMTPDESFLQETMLKEQIQARKDLQGMISSRMGVNPNMIQFSNTGGISVSSEVEKATPGEFKTSWIKAHVFGIDPNLNRNGIPLAFSANMGTIKNVAEAQFSDIKFYMEAEIRDMAPEEARIAKAIRTKYFHQVRKDNPSLKGMKDASIGTSGWDNLDSSHFQFAQTAYQAQKTALLNLKFLHLTQNSEEFVAQGFGTAQDKFNSLTLSYLAGAGRGSTIGPNGEVIPSAMQTLIGNVIESSPNANIGSIAAVLTQRGASPLNKFLNITEQTTMSDVTAMIKAQGLNTSQAFTVGSEFKEIEHPFTMQSPQSVPLEGPINATYKKVLGSANADELKASYDEYLKEVSKNAFTHEGVKQLREIKGTNIGGKAIYASIFDPRFNVSQDALNATGGVMTPELEAEQRRLQLTQYVGAKQIQQIAVGEDITFRQAYQRVAQHNAYGIQTRSPEFAGGVVNRVELNPTGRLRGQAEEDWLNAIDAAGGFNEWLADHQDAAKSEFMGLSNPIQAGMHANTQMGDNDGDFSAARMVSFEAYTTLLKQAFNEQTNPSQVAYERLAGMVDNNTVVKATRVAIAAAAHIDPKNVTPEMMVTGYINTKGEMEVAGLQAVLVGTTKAQNVIVDSINDINTANKGFEDIILNKKSPQPAEKDALAMRRLVSSSQQEFERGRSNADIYGLAQMMGLAMVGTDREEFNKQVERLGPEYADNQLDPYELAKLGALHPYQIPADFFQLPENIYTQYKKMESTTGFQQGRFYETETAEQLTIRMADALAKVQEWEAPELDPKTGQRLDSGANRKLSSHVLPTITLAQMLLPKVDGKTQYEDDKGNNNFERIVSEIKTGNLSHETIVGAQTGELGLIVRGFQAQNFLRNYERGQYGNFTSDSDKAIIDTERQKHMQFLKDNPDITERLLTVRRSGFPANVFYALATSMPGQAGNAVSRGNAAAGGTDVSQPPTTLPLPPTMRAIAYNSEGSNAARQKVNESKYFSATTLAQFFGQYKERGALITTFNRLTRGAAKLEESEEVTQLVGEKLSKGNEMEKIITGRFATQEKETLGYRFLSRDEAIAARDPKGKDRGIYAIPDAKNVIGGIVTSQLPDYIKVVKDKDGNWKLRMTDLKVTDYDKLMAKDSETGKYTNPQLQVYTMQQNIYAWGMVHMAGRGEDEIRTWLKMAAPGFREDTPKAKEDLDHAVEALRRGAVSGKLEDSFESLNLFVTEDPNDPIGRGKFVDNLNMYTSQTMTSMVVQAKDFFSDETSKSELWQHVAGMAVATAAEVAKRQNEMDQGIKGKKVIGADGKEEFVEWDENDPVMVRYKNLDFSVDMPKEPDPEDRYLEVARMAYEQDSFVQDKLKDPNAPKEDRIDSIRHQADTPPSYPGGPTGNGNRGNRGNGGGIDYYAGLNDPAMGNRGRKPGDKRFGENGKRVSDIIRRVLSPVGKKDPMSEEVPGKPGTMENRTYGIEMTDPALGDKDVTHDFRTFVRNVDDAASGRLSTGAIDRIRGQAIDLYYSGLLDEDAKKRVGSYLENMQVAIDNPMINPFKGMAGQSFTTMFRQIMDPSGTFRGPVKPDDLEEGVGGNKTLVSLLTKLPQFMMGKMGSQTDIDTFVNQMHTVMGTYAAGIPDSTEDPAWQQMIGVLGQAEQVRLANPTQRRKLNADLRGKNVWDDLERAAYSNVDMSNDPLVQQYRDTHQSAQTLNNIVSQRLENGDEVGPALLDAQANANARLGQLTSLVRRTPKLKNIMSDDITNADTETARHEEILRSNPMRTKLGTEGWNTAMHRAGLKSDSTGYREDWAAVKAADNKEIMRAESDAESTRKEAAKVSEKFKVEEDRRTGTEKAKADWAAGGSKLDDFDYTKPLPSGKMPMSRGEAMTLADEARTKVLGPTTDAIYKEMASIEGGSSLSYAVNGQHVQLQRQAQRLVQYKAQILEAQKNYRDMGGDVDSDEYKASERAVSDLGKTMTVGGTMHMAVQASGAATTVSGLAGKTDIQDRIRSYDELGAAAKMTPIGDKAWDTEIKRFNEAVGKGTVLLNEHSKALTVGAKAAAEHMTELQYLSKTVKVAYAAADQVQSSAKSIEAMAQGNLQPKQASALEAGLGTAALTEETVSQLSSQYAKEQAGKTGKAEGTPEYQAAYAKAEGEVGAVVQKEGLKRKGTGTPESVLNRLMSGYFAMQTMRAIRYTWQPVEQAGQQYGAEVQAENTMLGAAGLSTPLVNTPGYIGQRNKADWNLGFGVNAANTMSGAANLVTNIAGGNVANFGRSGLGAAASILEPAIGAGIITTLGLSQLASLGATTTLGSIGLAAGPIGLGVAGVAALGGAASYTVGALSDQSSSLRGLTNKGGIGNTDWSGGLQILGSTDVSAMLATAGRTARGLFSKIGVDTRSSIYGPRTEEDKWIESLGQDYITQQATGDESMQFGRTGIYAAKTVLEGAGQSGTYLNSIREKYGLSEVATRQLGAFAMGSPVSDQYLKSFTERLGEYAGSSIDYQQMLSMADQYQQGRGNMQISAGADYLAQKPLAELNRNQLAQKQMNQNVGGGVNNAMNMVWSGQYSNLTTAADITEQRGALGMLANFGFQQGTSWAQIHRRVTGEVLGGVVSSNPATPVAVALSNKGRGLQRYSGNLGTPPITDTIGAFSESNPDSANWTTEQWNKFNADSNRATYEPGYFGTPSTEPDKQPLNEWELRASEANATNTRLTNRMDVSSWNKELLARDKASKDASSLPLTPEEKTRKWNDTLTGLTKILKLPGQMISDEIGRILGISSPSNAPKDSSLITTDYSWNTPANNESAKKKFLEDTKGKGSISFSPGTGDQWKALSNQVQKQRNAFTGDRITPSDSSVSSVGSNILASGQNGILDALNPMNIADVASGKRSLENTGFGNITDVLSGKRKIEDTAVGELNIFAKPVQAGGIAGPVSMRNNAFTGVLPKPSSIGGTVPTDLFNGVAGVINGISGKLFGNNGPVLKSLGTSGSSSYSGPNTAPTITTTFSAVAPTITPEDKFFSESGLTATDLYGVSSSLAAAQGDTSIDAYMKVAGRIIGAGNIDDQMKAYAQSNYELQQYQHMGGQYGVEGLSNYYSRSDLDKIYKQPNGAQTVQNIAQLGNWGMQGLTNIGLSNTTIASMAGSQQGMQGLQRLEQFGFRNMKTLETMNPALAERAKATKVIPGLGIAGNQSITVPAMERMEWDQAMAYQSIGVQGQNTYKQMGMSAGNIFDLAATNEGMQGLQNFGQLGMQGAYNLTKLMPGSTPQGLADMSISNPAAFQMAQQIAAGDPRAITMGLQGGIIPRSTGIKPMMDLSTGAGLFQRSMWGLNSAGSVGNMAGGMPSRTEVSDFLTTGIGNINADQFGANTWAQGGARNQGILNALMGTTYGVGGQQGLSYYADNFQYQQQMAGLGVQAASTRANYNYQMNTTRPLQWAGMQLGRAQQVGGKVDLPFNLGTFDMGAGQRSWTQQGYDIDTASAYQGRANQLTQSAWAYQDIDRSQARNNTTYSWQQQSFGFQQQGRTLSRGWQDVGLGWQSSDMSRQAQYSAQDFAFNRQVNQLQFGWQMQDADISIRRSTGFERQQLVRQRDRAVEMQNLNIGHEDDLRKRQEEAEKRERDRFQAQIDYIKQTRLLEDAQFVADKSHAAEQKKWQDEDFNIRRTRQSTEDKWATDDWGRTLQRFKIRDEQFTASKAAEDAQWEIQKKQYEAEGLHLTEMNVLELANQGIAVETATTMKTISDAQKTLSEEENKRMLAFSNLQTTYYTKSAEFWNKVISAFNQLAGTNIPGISIDGSTGSSGENVTPPKALGGSIPRGSSAMVGELGPEIVKVDRSGNVTIKNSWDHTQQQPYSSSAGYSVTATPVILMLNDTKLGEAMINIIAKPMERSRRSNYITR